MSAGGGWAARAAVVLVVGCLGVVMWNLSAFADGTQLVLVPVADTYVSASSPGAAYGTGPTIEMDGSPRREAYLRFSVAEVAGLSLRSATLRLWVTNGTRAQVTVSSLDPAAWSESVTWDSRPVPGPVLQTFSPSRATGQWREVDVSAAVTGPGDVAFAIVGTSSDGAGFASRESAHPPELVVALEPSAGPGTSTTAVPPATVAPPVTTTTATTVPTATTTTVPSPTTTVVGPTSTTAPATVVAPTTTSTPITTTAAPTTTAPTTTTAPPTPPGDGLSTVASSLEGSSSPTSWSPNEHLAHTDGGRILAVHGFHASGLQLAWSDGAGTWSRTTRGAVTDGRLITGTGTGDWPASIVVGRDQAGRQHAWVAFGGDTATSGRPAYLRRLSGLDDPAGPSVGPLVLIAAPADGAAMVDLVIDQPAGRAAVSYATRNAAGSYDHLVTWFTDLDSDIPTFTGSTIRATGSSGYRTGALIATPSGVAFVHRNDANRLQVDTHRSVDAVGVWSRGTSGLLVASKTHVSAVALPSGEIVAVASPSTTTASIQRFSPEGVPVAVEESLSGHREVSLAWDGSQVWLAAVRVSDSAVVSRRRTGGTWSFDRIEIGPEGGGGYAWPSVAVAGGELHLLVEGPWGGGSQNAVLALRRAV